jgi:hypothetical protein
MATVAVTIQFQSIGTDEGPFDIADNVTGTLVIGITRSQLLAGYVVNADTAATQVTVTSTSLCGTVVNIPIQERTC